jgi:hypothetical protein
LGSEVGFIRFKIWLSCDSPKVEKMGTFLSNVSQSGFIVMTI